MRWRPLSLLLTYFKEKPCYLTLSDILLAWKASRKKMASERLCSTKRQPGSSSRRMRSRKLSNVFDSCCLTSSHSRSHTGKYEQKADEKDLRASGVMGANPVERGKILDNIAQGDDTTCTFKKNIICQKLRGPPSQSWRL